MFPRINHTESIELTTVLDTFSQSNFAMERPSSKTIQSIDVAWVGPFLFVLRAGAARFLTCHDIWTMLDRGW